MEWSDLIMARTIELTEMDVIVREGDKIEAIRIDETNERYVQLRIETKNFTENMVQKNELEVLQETVDTLVLDGLMGV